MSIFFLPVYLKFKLLFPKLRKDERESWWYMNAEYLIVFVNLSSQETRSSSKPNHYLSLGVK